MSMGRSTVFSAFLASVLALGLGPQGALAGNRTPAEIPPASYKGAQYVDSEGCVFIRAGSGGAVTWVPRVSRNRRQVCNARPTVVAQSGGQTTAASTAGNVVQLTVPNAARTQTRVTPPRITFRPNVQAPEGGGNVASNAVPATPRVTTSQVPVAQSTATTRRRPSVQVAARPAAVTPILRSTAPAVAPAPVRQVQQVQAPRQSANACGVTGISARYVNNGQHGPVRCGPQAAHPADFARGGATRAVRGTGRQTAVASTARSYGAPFEPVNANPRVASGYRTVWDDGRLNPNRGPRGGASAGGDRVLMWTSYAPYRLIDIATGQDVTAQYPQYAPPNGPSATATASYNFAQPTSSNGRYVATASTRNPVASTAPRAVRRATHSRAEVPVASTARAASPRSVTVGRGHKYVQLGTYGDPANVSRAIATLHRLGLPAAKVRTRQGGRQLEVVISGPFNDPNALGQALHRARQAGYGDAITRR